MSERVKTSLESEMEKLMSQAKELSGTADKSKENAAKTRRKSRDLEEQLSDMVSAGDQWAAVGMGRQRRASRDYTAAALKDAFTEIDADSSGYIDHAELEKAIKQMDPKATKETIDGMIAFADSDADNKVSFEEFTKIMLYKKEEK